MVYGPQVYNQQHTALYAGHRLIATGAITIHAAIELKWPIAGFTVCYHLSRTRCCLASDLSFPRWIIFTEDCHHPHQIPKAF